MDYNLITILGPTATGKTKLAAQLAAEFEGEIISADSRQVYKGMDIGTGKDLDDYRIENREIPYHLIDIIEPHKEFNLFLFKDNFIRVFKDIRNRNKTPFLVGGTGLYLSSVLQDYELKRVEFNNTTYNELAKKEIVDLKKMLLDLNLRLHNTTDLIEKERIIKAILIEKAEEKSVKKNEKIKSVILGIKLDRDEIKKRITERLKYRMESGMIDEVKSLIAKGISFDKLNFLGLEYRYLGQYIKGELNYNDMFQKLNSSIHHFAKRQMTWFRKMEKEGVKINWIQGPNIDQAREIISEKLYINKV